MALTDLLNQKPMHKILQAAIEDQEDKPYNEWSQEDFLLLGLRHAHRNVRNQLKNVERTLRITQNTSLEQNAISLQRQLDFIEEQAKNILHERLNPTRKAS